MEQPMIVVHHLENSRSQRILWLLEELGQEFSIKHYQRDPQTMLAPPELRNVHPLGKSPVIEDGDLVIAETGAIIEYLVNRADGRLGPPADLNGVIRYSHFLHYAEGSLMPPLFALLVVARIGEAGSPARDALLGMLKAQFDWLESELADRAWFAGDQFTAADVMMSFPIEAGTVRAQATQGRPNLSDWLERIHARTPYQRALKRGGPYAYA